MGRPQKLFAIVLCSLVLAGCEETRPEFKTQDIESSCASLNSPVSYTYCVTRDPQSTNPDILYFFHGMGGNAHNWDLQDVRIQHIQDRLKNSPRGAPTVVAVSFGPFWLLAESNSSPYSGLFEKFVNVIRPAIEAELGFDPTVGHRLGLGVSMGGFNLSQLLLKDSNDFARVVLLCPAITPVSPYSSPSELDDYVRETGARPELIQQVVYLARKFYPDEDSWERSSPLELASQRLGPATPPFYISCGDRDEFGFFEGAKAFADLARSNNAPVVWQAENGGHCSFNADSVADALIGP